MASETVTRNSCALRTSIESRLARALSETVPQYQIPAKTLAHQIGTSAATVESLRQSIPSAAVTIVAIGRVVPMFGLEMMDAMGIDIDQDRAAFAKFLEIHRMMQRGR